MSPRPVAKLLLCDIDNTLFDWNTYYARAFRALVHVASRELSVNEETLYRQLREVHQEFRSIEYPFSIQRIPAAQSLNEPDKRELVRKVRGAFMAQKRKRVVAFPGVSETLRWARGNGIQIAAVTNAPLHQASQRLSWLGISGMFDQLTAWEGGWPAPSPDDPVIGDYVPKDGTRIRIPMHSVVTHEELKPTTIPYERTLASFPEVDVGEVWAVGDSIGNDIVPANRLGITSVWARYGSQVEEKDLETLLRVTDWSDSQLRALKKPEAVSPDYTIDSFRMLIDIIEVEQPALFPLAVWPQCSS